MNIQQVLENMSEEEIQQLMATNFGEELEKEAAAEVAKAELVDALYAYGANLAETEVSSFEDLSKEASAELEKTAGEIAVSLEDALVSSGILDTDDTVALHKEAQAAAAFILEGYTDALEKIAADGGKMEALKQWAKAKKQAIAEGAKKGVAHVKANKGKYGAGAAVAGLGGLGAYMYRRGQEKKASELTAGELAAIIREEEAIDTVVSEGLSKMASAGQSKVEAMKAAIKSGYEKAKAAAGKGAAHVKAHKGKYGAGAAALGALGAAGLYMKKKKDQGK